jgi:hypothetical protein
MFAALICRVLRKSINLKHSPALRAIFRCRPGSQFVYLHHSVMSYELNMEDRVLINFYNALSNKDISDVFYCKLY